MTAQEIAEKIGGRVVGDGSVEITGMAGLEDAGAGDITFLSSGRYVSKARDSRAAAVVADEKSDISVSCTVIRVPDPDRGFALVAGLLFPEEEFEPGVHATAIISEDVCLGAGVSIGPYCVIGRGCLIGEGTVIEAGSYVGCQSRLGESCRIHPGVGIREKVEIGDRAIIHCGAVIGSDGFGYYREDGKWSKIPQVGKVQIGDDVEIGANVTIDRARVGATRIGNGVKIDNIVQIAHNVKIGDNTAMAALVGISGSAALGSNVQLAGQSGVAGHLKVGDNSVVFGKAGVTKDVPDGSFVSGFPAEDHRKQMKLQGEYRRLLKRRDRIRCLEERVKELEKRLSKDGGCEKDSER